MAAADLVIRREVAARKIGLKATLAGHETVILIAEDRLQEVQVKTMPLVGV